MTSHESLPPIPSDFLPPSVQHINAIHAWSMLGCGPRGGRTACSSTRRGRAPAATRAKATCRRGARQWASEECGGDRGDSADTAMCTELNKTFLFWGRLCQSRTRVTSLHYRVDADGNPVDLGFVCYLARYCFLCSILLGQVGIRQNGQSTLAAMVETTNQKIV